MDDAKLLTEGPETYDRDFFAWSRAQAAALRAVAAGGNAPLDYENLAEAIESLGNRDRRELGSRIATIIEHLFKLQMSPTVEPRAGWRATVRRERSAIEDILDDSPSLRRHIGDLVRKRGPKAIDGGERELRERGELIGTPAELAEAIERCLDPDDVTGDWLPLSGQPDQ